MGDGWLGWPFPGCAWVGFAPTPLCGATLPIFDVSASCASCTGACRASAVGGTLSDAGIDRASVLGPVAPSHDHLIDVDPPLGVARSFETTVSPPVFRETGTRSMSFDLRPSRLSSFDPDVDQLGPTEMDLAASLAQSEQASLTPPVLIPGDETESDDAVRLYLREIGRVPLLNAQTEVQLAKAIERGRLAVEALADPAGAKDHRRALREDGDASLGDFVADREIEDPVDTAARNILRKEVHGILSELSDRERRILELRYGLGLRDPLTLQEIGVEVGLTRERVRQIECEALDKLRLAVRSQNLRELLV